MKTSNLISCFFTTLFVLFLSLSSSPLLGQSLADSTLSNEVSILKKQVAEMKQGSSHFMIVGLTTFGFYNQNTSTTLGGLKTSSNYNSLGDVNRYEFSPLFLWRHGDDLLLEFEPSFNGSGLGVNWAAISYFITPGLIARGGYFVLPFGTYSKRLAAGWVNKLASDPIGSNPAGSDFGVEVEGGFPLGSMKGGYDLAISNGFQLNPDGTIASVGISAINNNKTISGRLSLLPLSNSSLELGVSGLFGTLATPTGSTINYQDPMVSMYGLDLHFIENLNPVQINIKGQYNLTKVNSQNYTNPLDSTQRYSFTNNTNASFGQISVRPIQLESKVFKNLELAYRHVNYKTPSGSTWGQNYTENDIGLDYWLSWRTVLKITYEGIKSDGTSSVALSGIQGSTNINRIVLQFSTGL